jgi:hypothetical protein
VEEIPLSFFMLFCDEIGGMGAYIIQNELWFWILGDKVLKNRLTDIL